MVSSAVTGMVQPVTKVAGSVGSQSGQDNSGNVDFARIMNSSVRNDVTGNSSKQTNTYSAAPSDSLVSMGANKSNKNADIVTTNSTVKNVKTDNAVKENSNKMTQDVQNAVSDIKEKIKKTMNVSDEDIRLMQLISSLCSRRMKSLILKMKSHNCQIYLRIMKHLKMAHFS